MTHTTVLLTETVEGLNLKKSSTAIDATVGVGGHAALLAEAVGERGTVVLIDADPNSLAAAREHLKGSAANLIYLNGNFRNLKALAAEAGIAKADGIVFDLGWHAGQLGSGKGFSFMADEPLLMTLGTGREGLTARDIIADWDEVDIAHMIREYGEERFADRIARAIVEARKKTAINTTAQLVTVIESVVKRSGRIHPATKTFQALRIAVNDELEALKEGIAAAIDIAAPGGRIAVISFHSLEDRIVKQAFRMAEDAGVGMRITKKPLTPGSAERTSNPRSRSAKLRIFEKGN